MPTVLIIEGCIFRIFTDDHPPPHVHVYVGDSVVVLFLDEQATLRDKKGKVKASEVKKARRLAVQHREFLLREWQRIHNG